MAAVAPMAPMGSAGALPTAVSRNRAARPWLPLPSPHLSEASTQDSLAHIPMVPVPRVPKEITDISPTGSDGGSPVIRKRPVVNDRTGILLQGPIEQKKFLGWWRTRWAVITPSEFLLFRSEEDFKRRPDKPRHSYDLYGLSGGVPKGMPQVVLVRDIRRGTVTLLRTGAKRDWKSQATATLWAAALSAV